MASENPTTSQFIGQWSSDGGKTWHDTAPAPSVNEVIFTGMPSNAAVEFRFVRWEPAT
jgi:hypothetical protein